MQEGLEQHLLSLLVTSERADLEEDRNRLIRDGAAMARELQALEDRVLSLLSGAKGAHLPSFGVLVFVRICPPNVFS